MPRLWLDLRPYPLLERVQALLTAGVLEIYITGGFVRDLVLGRPVKDADFTVGTGPLPAARLVADALGGSFVAVSDIAEREVGRVVLPHMTLDFAQLRGTIQEDLGQRDFTIDALALDLSLYPEPPIIDPWGGLSDIAGRRLRALHPRVFQEDPARLLRGPRLAAELGFSLEPATADLVREQAHLLTRASAERLREELCKLLAASQAAPQVFLLEDLGLLARLIPELEECRGVSQPPEHHWDVLQHSLEAVARAEALLERPGPSQVISTVPWGPDLEAHFAQEVSSGHRRYVLLKLAALIHDVAKPAKKTVDDTGRIHFYSHAREGAALAQAIMERLRFSSREARMVSQMVEHHLRPRQMVSLRTEYRSLPTESGSRFGTHSGQDEELPTARAIYRYFRDLGEVAIDTLYLNLADHWASRGPGLVLEDWQHHAATVAYILEQWRQGTAAVKPLRLVTGHDLMQELGLEPGPVVGELLEAIKEAQASGQVTTREDALAWAKGYLSHKNGLPEFVKERQ